MVFSEEIGVMQEKFGPLHMMSSEERGVTQEKLSSKSIS
jgi:hypothetical protein